MCIDFNDFISDLMFYKCVLTRASSVLDCLLDPIEVVGEADVNHGQHLSPPAPDSYTHCARRSAAIDHSSPQPSDCLTQALSEQSLSAHIAFL